MNVVLEPLKERLLRGLEESIRERGYVATTVSDIVAAAGTSKRTFYQSFATKAECLIEHYERFHAEIIEAMRVEAPRAQSSYEATVIGVEIYFRTFVTQPAVARAHLMDILTLGERGMRVRHDIARGYAANMSAIMALPRHDRPAVRLTVPRALGILGGVNEIALDVIVGPVPATPDDVDEAAAAAVDFVRAVIADLPPVEESEA